MRAVPNSPPNRARVRSAFASMRNAPAWTAKSVRASVGAAAACDTRDHFGCNACVELTHCEIIEEEQRHGALHRDVVHAVVHQILAYRGMPTRQERQFQFCADAVGR